MQVYEMSFTWLFFSCISISGRRKELVIELFVLFRAFSVVSVSSCLHVPMEELSMDQSTY